MNTHKWFERPNAALTYSQHPPVTDTMPGFLKEIRSYLREGIRVLDVGSGPGILSFAIATIGLRGVEVFGIDKSWPFIQLATRLNKSYRFNSTFGIGDAHALPYANECIDLVVSQMALKWFDDRTLALREMYRVLKPGGNMLIAESGGNELIEVFILMHEFFIKSDIHSLERRGWKNFLLWLKKSLFTPSDLFHFLEEAFYSQRTINLDNSPEDFK